MRLNENLAAFYTCLISQYVKQEKKILTTEKHPQQGECLMTSEWIHTKSTLIEALRNFEDTHLSLIDETVSVSNLSSLFCRAHNKFEWKTDYLHIENDWAKSSVFEASQNLG